MKSARATRPSIEGGALAPAGRDMKDFGLSREVPVKRGQTALLFVDVQNYSAEGGGKYAGLSPEIIEARYGYFFRKMRERVVPNMRRLQFACRKAGSK